MNIGDSETLRKVYLEKIKDLDFKALGQDVKSFLFRPEDVGRVENFYSFFEKVELE